MRRAGTAGGFAALLAATVWLSACKTASECNADPDCPGGGACVGQLCVARIAAENYPAAVELEPAVGARVGRRDFPSVVFSAAPLDLQADGLTPTLVTLANPVFGPTDRPSAVRAVLFTPSLLLGRPAISFATTAINKGPMQPYEVLVDLPALWQGQNVGLDVFPLPALDRLVCPWRLNVVIAPEAVVILPGPNESLLVEGSVLPPVPSDPPVVYEARLYVGDQLESNVARSEPSGRFVLRVQRNLVEGKNDAHIEIAAADPIMGAVSLSLPFSGQTNLGTFRFPPVPQPLPFQVPVVLDDAGKTAVPGASVRFVTSLGGASAGELRYTALAQSGKDGRAAIALLPGSEGMTRDYVVSVLPPGKAEAGSLCLASYGIAAPGTAVGVGAALILPRKAVLSGHITRFEGAPAAGLRVIATSLVAAAPPACGRVLTPPIGETVSDADGAYQLMLNPGSYRLDFVPPAGSGLPRHTVPSFAIGATTTLDIDLPEAVLGEGRVFAPGGLPLAGVTVNAFAPRVDGALPLGTAVSGEDGRFRMVLPRLR